MAQNKYFELGTTDPLRYYMSYDDNKYHCIKCGHVSPDLRGMASHIRAEDGVHVECPFCGTQVLTHGIGGHVKNCAKNPLNQMTAEKQEKLVTVSASELDLVKPVILDDDVLPELITINIDEAKGKGEGTVPKTIKRRCPYCGKYFHPHGITQHKNRCAKNTTARKKPMRGIMATEWTWEAFTKAEVERIKEITDKVKTRGHGTVGGGEYSFLRKMKDKQDEFLGNPIVEASPQVETAVAKAEPVRKPKPIPATNTTYKLEDGFLTITTSNKALIVTLLEMVL